MAALNKMTNGRSKDGQQPLLDDSDSDVQEFALQTVSPHRSRRRSNGVRVKSRGGGGGSWCRGCVRAVFLFFNLALLGCVGFLGYKGWLLMRDVNDLKHQVLELQALQKNDAATAQRLLNSQADSQRNSGDFSQKVTDLDSQLQKVDKSYHADVEKLRTTMTDSRAAANKELEAVQTKLQQQITELGLSSGKAETAQSAAKTVLARVEDLRTTHASFVEDVRTMNRTMKASMEKAASSVGSDIASLRDMHTVFADAVRATNASMSKSMAAMSTDMKQTSQALVDFKSEHKAMDGGMRANMSRMQTAMNTMTTDISSLQGDVSQMEKDMTSMTNTMNAMAAANQDEEIPTLPPRATEPQVGMEILEQLNASLRQSFQKLVGAVRMEHRSRLAEQKNISNFLLGIQQDVISLNQAVEKMNSTAAHAFQQMPVAPTQSTATLEGPPMVSMRHVLESIQKNFTGLTKDLVATTKRVLTLENGQQMVNSSLATHRRVTMEKFAQLMTAMPSTGSVETAAKGGLPRNVNWTAVLTKAFTSPMLLAAVRKVNMTAMQPVFAALMDKMQPVFLQYIQHLSKNPKVKALLAGKAAGELSEGSSLAAEKSGQQIDNEDEEKDDDFGESKIPSPTAAEESNQQTGGEDETENDDTDTNDAEGEQVEVATQPPGEENDEDDMGTGTDMDPTENPEEQGTMATVTDEDDDDEVVEDEATDNPLVELPNSVPMGNEEEDDDRPAEDPGVSGRQSHTRQDESMSYKEVLDALISHFRGIDVDANGRLSKEEMIAALESVDNLDTDTMTMLMKLFYQRNRRPVTRSLLRAIWKNLGRTKQTSRHNSG